MSHKELKNLAERREQRKGERERTSARKSEDKRRRGVVNLGAHRSNGTRESKRRP